MSDGIISGLAKDCPTGPTGNNYYSGTGNFVKVKDGNTEYLYAHLQWGSPIAINPRSEKAKYSFKVGDHVYQGDIIGYTGRSGNAHDVSNPHLHLTIRVNGTPVDPAPYLNGTVNIQNGGIYGIICDDK